MAPISFEEYRATLAPIEVASAPDPALAAEIHQAAERLVELPTVDRASLTALVADDPEIVPVLALCVGMSREELKGFLRYRFGTPSHRLATKRDAAGVVRAMDETFDLVNRVAAQRARKWTFADVLVARALSRSRATTGMGRGRRVEDAVEAVVSSLDLPYQMRTRFVGRDGRDAPADLAIPAGGKDAAVVCGIKAFDSTGSKLSDAVSELRAMGEIRLPSQYVFAVVDGIGWLRRQSDLRRIYEFWERNFIDGLYSVSMLGAFKADLKDAARRRGLL